MRLLNSSVCNRTERLFSGKGVYLAILRRACDHMGEFRRCAAFVFACEAMAAAVNHFRSALRLDWRNGAPLELLKETH